MSLYEDTFKQKTYGYRSEQPLYHSGMRCYLSLDRNKTGVIRRLRSDSFEDGLNAQGMWNYYVDWDDGTFETYMGQMFIRRL